MARRTAREDQRPSARRRARSGGAPEPTGLLPDLDRLIHERMRLGIMSALAVNETLSFQELKETLQTTDGNLSVHARKLEQAAYIVCSKTFVGRMPKTEYALTKAGRKALEEYLAHMEAIIAATRDDAVRARPE